MRSNNESGCAKIISILAGVATIIGGIIAILTWLMPFNPIGPSPLASPQTHQQSNGESLSELPTSTFLPLPTDTPSPTLVPTLPLLPDTAHDTILEYGQTWRQNGIEITLTDKTLLVSVVEGSGIGFEVDISNYKPFDIAMSLALNNLTAIDNFSRQLKVSHICQDGRCWSICEPTAYVLASGEDINVCGEGFVFVSVDISDSSITEIIVTFSNTNIGEAHWSIPIYH